MNYEYEEYEDFDVYSFNSCLFIRVKNENCLNWIPLMYEYYNEYMDFLYEEPRIAPIKNSNELVNLKFVN